MKKITALLLVLCMLLALAACGGNTETPAASESEAAPAETSAEPSEEPSAEETPEETTEATGEPIKIGHICDLTGVETMTGEEAKRALEFAVDMIGGQIAGRPVEIIVGDAQGQASVAVDVARKMVEQDGVVAIFGPTQIGQKTAVSEYMQEAGIPLIFYNGTPLGILASNEWLVGSGGATPQMPTVMADYVYNELGYGSVNVISMDNTGYRAYLEPFMETFEALGGTVVSQQWAPIPCADWAPYLTTLEDADAIVAWASGSDAISLWTAWCEMGISEKMPIVGAMHGGFTDYFVPTALSKSNPAAAEAMLGALAPMMYALDSQTPENQAFVEAWTEAFGQGPAGTNLPGACTQAMLLFEAAVEALNGDTAPDKLIEAILAADVTGPEGHVYFDNSHAATKDVHIVEVVQLEDGSYNYSQVKTYSDVPPTGLAH